MSLNAMHRYTMVFSDDEDKAITKMNELVSNEEVLKRTKYRVETKSGTYQAMKFNNGCRGFRYREVYVDESLKNDDETMFLIRCKLVSPGYYQGFEKDIEYKQEDHIHYFSR